MPNPTSSPSTQSVLAKIASVPAASWTDDRCRSAILDSTLAAWHSRQTDAAAHEHKPPPAERIPIPEIGFAEQRPFIHLYAEIQAAKRADTAADTRELEWRLDELVYALYGLTEAESTAIERSLGMPPKKLTETMGNADYYVAVLTADEPAPNPNEGSRSRQNAIGETMTIATSKPNRLTILRENDVDIPSNLQGIGYIDLQGQWGVKLMKEFKAANLI